MHQVQILERLISFLRLYVLASFPSHKLSQGYDTSWLPPPQYLFIIHDNLSGPVRYLFSVCEFI